MINNFERCARTIAGLYNNSIPLEGKTEKMSVKEAAGHAMKARKEGKVYFNFLNGRPMNLSISNFAQVDRTSFYDKANGVGAAEKAIEDGLKDPLYSNFDWNK